MTSVNTVILNKRKRDYITRSGTEYQGLGYKYETTGWIHNSRLWAKLKRNT